MMIQHVLILFGVLLPLTLAFYVFLSRERIYTTWAKTVSIAAAFFGVLWAVIHWYITQWRNLHLDRDTYYALVGYKGMAAGLTLGFALSVWIARPYTKRLRNLK